MTPKDKAKELIEKFIMYDIEIVDLMGCVLDGYEDNHYKQCALIFVDKMLKADKKEDLDWAYWNNVKNEINKL